MLLAHNMPKYLREEAIAYAPHLKNICPTHSLPHTTPYQALWKKKPDLLSVHNFGTDCWVRVNIRTSKLNAQSVKRTFVGIRKNTVGYQYYVPESCQVLTSREVIFPKPSNNLGAPVVKQTSSGPEGESTFTPSTPPSTPMAKEVWSTPHTSETSPDLLPTPILFTPSTPGKPKPELVIPSAPRARRTNTRINYLKLNDGPQKTLRALAPKPKTRSSSRTSSATSKKSVSKPLFQGEITEIPDAEAKTHFCYLADSDSP
ncbi:hypothetical protein BC835DRAFT_1414272 [Cytidiella melzeri]|nr:hypothetical protein BC835DRAFT_1414272 [Cytidiella melzeri]